MKKEKGLSDKQINLLRGNIGYDPVSTDEQKIAIIDSRFEAMKAARTAVDQNRNIWQKMIEARYKGYEDDRSSSVVPLITAMADLFVAEATKIPTEPVFKSENDEYTTQAKALEYVRKYDWKMNNREDAIDWNEYVTAYFGTSIMYTGFESYDRTQQDFVVDDDMNYTWKENTYKDEKIIMENADIRLFYIDNQAIDNISQASDCIYRQWMSFEKFQNFKNSPVYKNIDKVEPRDWSSEYQAFFTKEDSIRQGDFVNLVHYRNVEKDIYMVVANGILIREHPMVSTIDGKKALPFVIRVLGKRIFSIYGRGFCEAAMTFNSDLNNLREMLMDGVKRSNMPTIAIGGGLQFNGRNFSFDNQILTFNGKLNNDNFQQIAGIPPNQAIFEQIDRIYKEIAYFVGIDVTAILGQPNKTAFEVEVQRESGLKRVNVWLKNRGLAFERLFNLHKDNLQTYFPRKTADGLYPQLQAEGERLSKGKIPKFISTPSKKSRNIFEITPEVLRGQIYVDVNTDTSVNTINAVDKQRKLEFSTSLPQALQAYVIAQQLGVDLNEIMPMKQFITQLADDCNLNISGDTGTNDDTQQAITQLGDELLQGANQQPTGVHPEGQVNPVAQTQPSISNPVSAGA